jgi:hypothetical protein
MTGNLLISKAWPALVLDRPAAGSNNQLLGRTNGLSRWELDLGEATAEAGSNAGSNFQIVRYNDAGTNIGVPLTINRSTGVVDVPALTIAGVPAAPFDAMAYSGMQINGSMEVSQERGASGSTTTNGTYICDCWRFLFVGTMAPSGGITGNFAPGFSSYIYATNSVAQPALGAGDYILLMQTIEGNRISRLGFGTANAQPITIGFWSSHTPAGTYTAVVRNGAASRSYVFSYTQNVAGTPEYKTVTVPGDTSGTWTNDNSAGMSIIFAMACGTGNTAPSLNTWLAGGYVAGPGQINGVATISSAIRITAVVVLPGQQAPQAARSAFVMRPYDQELITCKRQWQSFVNNWSIWCGDGNAYPTLLPLPVSMRATPTIDASGMTAPGGGGNLAGYPQYSAGPDYFVSTLASGGAKICGVSGTVKLSARL